MNHTDLSADLEGFAVVLASTSPRRQALLRRAGLDFITLAIDIDETIAIDERADDYLKRMVIEKSQAAQIAFLSPDVSDDSHHYAPTARPTLIITADTIGITSAGQILIKPTDFLDAKRMWRALSGRSHTIATAVCVSAVDSDGTLITSVYTVVETQVSFIKLDDAMMAAYWATGEPQDKAGGYAIQGIGRAWMRAIKGSFDNVVGLPVDETLVLLGQVAGRCRGAGFGA